MYPIKKEILAISMVMLLGMAGCSGEQSQTASFQFGEDLVFTEGEGTASIDLERSSELVKEKHTALQALLPDTETVENTVALTTTTANILWEAGVVPIGAPDSKALLPEIQQLQYTLEPGIEFDRSRVLNIGSALSPNTELIIELNPKLALYSNTMIHAEYMSTLRDAGVNIAPLGQSDYIDMFVLMDVLAEVYQYKNEEANALMQEMVGVLKETNALVEAKSSEETKTIAVLQLAGESIFVNGDQSALGQIVKSIGLENVFASAQNVELNQEALIAANPDYIIYYSHGMGGEVLDGFAERLTDTNGIFYTLNAVKNGNAFPVQGEDFQFAASVDLDILKVIQFLATKVYGES